MNYCKFISFLILMLSFKGVFAQYGDAYHSSNTYKLEQMRQDRININNASHRANINSKQGSTGSYAPGKSFPYMMSQKQKDDIAYRVKLAAEARDREERDRLKREEWKRIRIEDDKRENEYIRQNIPEIMGFGVEEGDALVNLLGSFSFINDSDNNSNGKRILRAKAFELAGYVEKFNNEINTTDYDELLYYVYTFKEFPLTAFSSIEKLKKMYPDKKEELNSFLLIEVMPIFFNGMRYEHSVFVKPINDDPTFSELNYCNNPKEFLKRKVEVRNYFLSLEKDYSEAFKIGIGKINFDNSPYVVIAKQALKDKKEDVAESYFLKQLNCPTQAYYEQNESFNNYVYRNQVMLDFLKKKSKEFKKFEYQDFVYIARIKGLSFIEVLELFDVFKFIDGNEIGKFNASKECKGSYECFSCGKYSPKGFSYSSHSSSKAKDLIYQAVQENEPSALNAYGLMVAAGETNEPEINCFIYFKKAFDLNYAWSAYNYLAAVSWRLKGYNDVFFNQGVDIWNGYKPLSEIEKRRFESAKLTMRKLEMFHFRYNKKYHDGMNFKRIE